MTISEHVNAHDFKAINACSTQGINQPPRKNTPRILLKSSYGHYNALNDTHPLF